MDHSALSLNSKERQQWVKITGLKTKYEVHVKTMRMRVMAPYLFGEEFLPIKWQQWAEEATLTTFIDKWLEVEPVDVDEYYKIDYLSNAIQLVANQVSINLQSNGGDFQRLNDLVVKLDKVKNLTDAKDYAEEEVAFERLWNRLPPSDEDTKVALMIAVYSYVQFAGSTVRKKDLLAEMTLIDPRDRKVVEDLKNKGNEEHKNDHYSKAVALYSKAIRISRYDHNLYNNRSLAFLNMKRFNHALMDAKRALTINPNSSKAHYRYSQALFELGYIKLAIKSNSTAIELFKKGSHNDSSVKDLESQRVKFDERLKATPCLDDVPDLVDPSSSDSEFSDMEQGEVEHPRGAIKENQNGSRHKVFTTEDQKAALKFPKKQRSEATKKEEKKAKKRKKKEMSEEEKRRAESDAAKREKEEKEEARRKMENEEKKKAKKREVVRARLEAALAEKQIKEQEEQKEQEEARKIIEKLEMEKAKRELANLREENERKLEEEAKRREAALKNQQEKALNAEHLKEMEEKNELESQLRHGSEAMIEQRGRQAFMFYKTAMDLITKSSKKYGGMCEEDYVTFLYAYGLACLESGIDEEIVDASSKFMMIIENHNRIRIPLPYYGLCKAFLKQNKFSDLNDPLGKAKYMAEKFTSVVETWPGTKHKIKVTEEGEMEAALMDLESIFKHPPSPDAICRYQTCPHKPEIYLTDLGFKGYVKVICSERCHMDYHVTCWKKVKGEEFFDASTEKEILTKDCGTPDCDGYFVSVAVFGPDGLCITQHGLSDSDKTKERKNKGASKQQTKKNIKTKKQGNEKGQGDLDNKKASLDDREEQQEGEKKPNKEKKLEAEQAELNPRYPSPTSVSTVSDATSTTSSNTADAGNGDDEEDNDEDDREEEDVKEEAVYILKKEDYKEEPAVSTAKMKAKAVRPKTRRKRTKDTASSVPIEVKFKSNSLKDKMDRVFANPQNSFLKNVTIISNFDYPGLFEDEPFSVPPKLKESASEFEQIYNAKKTTNPKTAGTKTQEEKSQITALRLHFEEVLGRLGPVPITDTLLGNELKSMPNELQAVVEGFGGLEKFLMKSSKFKMIDDHVCLLQDASKCKGMVEVIKASRKISTSHPVSSNFGGGASYWSNSRANLAPEHFPNIKESLASGSAEIGQKRPGEATSSSKMDTLDGIFSDSEETRAARMLSALDGIGKVETKSHIEIPDDEEIVEASGDNSKILEKDDTSAYKIAPLLTEKQRCLTADGVDSTPELDKTSQLCSSKDETSPDDAKPKTSILNEIFFPHKLNPSNKETNENNQSVSLPSESQSGVINESKVNGDSNKMLNSADIAFGANVSFGLDSSKPSDILKNGSFVMPAISDSDGLLSMRESLASEQAPGAKADVLDYEESGFYSTRSSESSFSSSSSSSSSGGKSISSYLSSESHSLDRESVKAATSNPIVKTKFNAGSDEGTDTDSLANHEGQLRSIEENTTEPLQFYSPTASDPVSTENATPIQGNLDTSKPNPSESPLTITDVAAAASTVSIAKYNELLQKYKMIYEACKVYTERKKSLKCTWTQCPKPSMLNKALNTEPTMMQLIDESPQVGKLMMNLQEMHTKLLETEKLHHIKEGKLKSDLAESKTREKETRNCVDGLESRIKRIQGEKRGLEIEKGDIGKEVSKRDAKIEQLEQHMAKLIEEIKSKDEQSKATAKNMQTEKDLWLAEKMKIEETSSNLIRSEQKAQKQCQEAEIMVLHMQCDRDLVPVKEAIRECENELNRLNHLFRSGRGSNLNENQREYMNTWQNSHEDNVAIAATLKNKYEEYVLKIKSGHLLNQLPAIEPPKPIRPLKFPAMPPHVMQHNMQQRGRPGVDMPFGVRMPGGPRNMRMPPSNYISMAPPNQTAQPNQMAPSDQTAQPNQMPPTYQMPPTNQMTSEMALANKMAPSNEILQPGQMAPPLQMPGQSQMPPPLQMPGQSHMSVKSANVGSANRQVGPNAPALAPGASNMVAAVGSSNQYQREQQGTASPQEIQAMTRQREPSPPSVPVSLGLFTQLSGFPEGQAPSKEAAYPGRLAQGHAQVNAARIPVSLAGAHPPWLTQTTTAVRMSGQSTGPQSSQFSYQQGVRQSQPQEQLQTLSKSPVTVASLSGPQMSVSPVSQVFAAAKAAAQKPTPVNGAAAATAQPKSNFDKIIFPLQNMFPEFNKVQLTKVIKDVRAANNNSLSGLSIEEIIHRAAELILNQQKPSPELQRMNAQLAANTQGGGMTSKRPTNGVGSSSLKWEPAKQPPKSAWAANKAGKIDFEEEEDPCVICHEEMQNNLVTLRCGHKFHPYCIRLWLQEQRTCPTCRNYTLLPEDYPVPI